MEAKIVSNISEILDVKGIIYSPNDPPPENNSTSVVITGAIIEEI